LSEGQGTERQAGGPDDRQVGRQEEAGRQTGRQTGGGRSTDGIPGRARLITGQKMRNFELTLFKDLCSETDMEVQTTIQIRFFYWVVDELRGRAGDPGDASTHTRRGIARR